MSEAIQPEQPPYPELPTCHYYAHNDPASGASDLADINAG
jgi:hypothetical protein